MGCTRNGIYELLLTCGDSCHAYQGETHGEIANYPKAPYLAY
jgi:hypothetical protein